MPTRKLYEISGFDELYPGMEVLSVSLAEWDNVVSWDRNTGTVRLSGGRLSTLHDLRVRMLAEAPPQEDPVRPSHYTLFNGAKEVMDLIYDRDAGYNEGNAIKYLMRWKHKNGVEDLKKCFQSIEYLIAEQEG